MTPAPDASPTEPTSIAVRDSLLRKSLAWGVHLLTASGAVIGAVALIAIVQGTPRRAAALMLIAFGIDSIDGTLARRVRVEEVLPYVNGRRLDDMVDYLNYVIVPAVFMVWAGSVSSWWVAAAPILASAYGFANEDAKTEDDFFLGFPSYWNFIAIYLWLFQTPPLAGSLVVVGFSILVFVPIKYLYPSKMPIFRRSMNVVGFVWCWALGVCVLWPDMVGIFPLREVSLLYPAWYLFLSFRMGGIHRRGD
jgi:phosphatidylcholine synthase